MIMALRGGVSLILVASALLATPSIAQIAPTKATLPSMRTGCLPVLIPYVRATADAGEVAQAGDDAATIFETTRQRWQDIAIAAKMKRRGALYVAIEIPPKDFEGKETPGGVCAVVEGNSPEPDMTVRLLPSRQGFLGYCKETDAEVCMAAVFQELGFTDENPWPRLPIYSLWRDEVPEPVEASDVVEYLALAAFDVRPSEEADGITRSFEINDLSECDDELCDSAPEAADISAGRGIAWFLELKSAETPRRSPQLDSQNEEQ